MQFHEIVSFENLRKNSFGVLEPNEDTKKLTGRLDAMIVPGVAFDKYRTRLGRGGGYS